MRRLLTRPVVLCLVLFGSLALHAQNSATVTGVVTDATGAILPGVAVDLVDTKTNSAYHAKTSSTGSYTIPSVRPGPGYKMTFSVSGFQSTTINDLELPVATTRTQNARLRVGTSATVDVSAKEQTVTIDTTDASVGNNLDIKLLNDLPIQDRSSAAVLFSLQPGVGDGGSITGARTDQSTVTVDGLDANDIASGQTFAIIPNEPVDALEEFRGTVAGQLVSAGPGGGGQFQLSTKNGTNKFHGDLNEYHRDTTTEANGWFNNNAGIPRTPLIQNQFGGQVGGPILRDRLFFFFNFYDSRIISSTSVAETVPLDSFRNGNIQYILNTDAAGNVCTGASRQNTTPQCIGTLDSAQVAALDPQHIGFDPTLLAFIDSRYPHANDLTLGDGVNTGGYRFTTPTPDLATNYVGRGDYNLNRTMKIFGRFTQNRENATQSAPEFPGDPVTHPFVDRSYSYVAGHIWSIGSNKVNLISYGDAITKYNFATTYNPSGIYQLSFGGLSGPYSGASSQKRRVPIPQIRDDFNWQKGSHNFGFGGTSKFIKTDSNLVNDFNFVGIGLGGNVSQLNATLRPADIRTAGTTSSADYDRAFTLALGRVGSIGSNYNYNAAGMALPQGNGATRRYRYFENEMYAGDTWKVNKQLTLSYGLKYMLYSVPYEADGSESIQNFTFDKYFSAREAQSAAGNSGDSSLPFIVYNLGGKANHAAPLYQPNYKDFAPRLAFAYNPASFPKMVFNGGAGIVFDRTVINAVNFIQDQSSYLFQNSANTNYGSADANMSLLTDPRIGANNAVPAPPTAPAIGHPFTPYVSDGTPYGLPNNEFNTIVNPTLKDPYSIAFNAGVQQEIPGDFVLKINYVGRLGRRLLAQADASQLVDFKDPVSGQLYSQAFGNLTQQIRAGADPGSVAPQPWLENVVAPGIGQELGYGNNTQLLASFFESFVSNGDFADFTQALAANGLIASNVGMASQLAENTFVTNKGFSSYNGLLVTVDKNLSRGLKFDFNYTWSHSTDNTSLVANSIAFSSGVGFICDAARPRECHSNSDFDITNVFNGDFTYELPVGRGRTFLSSAPRWLDETIGGWAVSGIPTLRTGIAYTTVSNAFVAGYANNAPSIFNGQKGDIQAHPKKQGDGSVNVYKNFAKAQSDFTGPIGFTIGSRNNLRTPSGAFFDAGLKKTFPIVEKVDLVFRADAFNVFNHPVFSGGVSDITSGQFGQITSTISTARVAQFALRLEF